MTEIFRKYKNENGLLQFNFKLVNLIINLIILFYVELKNNKPLCMLFLEINTQYYL